MIVLLNLVCKISFLNAFEFTGLEQQALSIKDHEMTFESYLLMAAGVGVGFVLLATIRPILTNRKTK